MDLLQHNKTAYDAVVEHLQHSDLTCVIHPTGTGKEIKLEESAVFMDIIGADTEPAIEQPVIGFLVESLQDARGDS